ncbi:MAG: polyprenyl synthetase family protein [Anaerolineae bacterium]|jgi:geranylgeranyl pyrophosphate synthase|nr:polyprenyl synthetase family protein [Anaerolineae bacterium]
MAMNVAYTYTNGHSSDRLDLDARVQDALEAIDHRMVTACDSDVTVLRDASRHILAAGGKRYRPRLTVLAYLACGGKNPADVTDLAAALELVHTASVVHDDINDHGVMRRGRPSVNAIWGRTFALLTGDFLFTKVYELMAPHRDLNVVLAEATVALVEGETLQAQAVKENRFTREVYMDIIARKTAALFKAGAILGSRKAGAKPDVVEALALYGYNIGLAFQVIDDILDLTADSIQLGKTSGIDLDQGRGFAAVADKPVEDPMEAIKRKAFSGDTIQKGRDQARVLVEMAIAQLDVLPDSAAKSALVSLAHQTIDRIN